MVKEQDSTASGLETLGKVGAELILQTRQLD